MHTIFARKILRLYEAKIGAGNIIKKKFMTFPINTRNNVNKKGKTMGIAGIGSQTAYYHNITENKTAQNTQNNKNFADIISEVEEAGNGIDGYYSYEELIFGQIGKDAPKEVKDTWMAAAKEAGINGFGMKENGMLSHISQLMVERIERSMRGEADPDNLLGSTVASARKAIEKALYDLEHPLAPNRSRTAKNWEWVKKEKHFYEAFLEKLSAN